MSGAGLRGLSGIVPEVSTTPLADARLLQPPRTAARRHTHAAALPLCHLSVPHLTSALCPLASAFPPHVRRSPTHACYSRRSPPFAAALQPLAAAVSPLRSAPHLRTAPACIRIAATPPLAAARLLLPPLAAATPLSRLAAAPPPAAARLPPPLRTAVYCSTLDAASPPHLRSSTHACYSRRAPPLAAVPMQPPRRCVVAPFLTSPPQSPHCARLHPSAAPPLAAATATARHRSPLHPRSHSLLRLRSVTHLTSARRPLVSALPSHPRSP